MKPIDKNNPHIRITISCAPCDLPIEGYASAIDPTTDAEIANDIRKQLRDGNEWAWCNVTVTVAYKGVLFGHDSIGACSYASEADFKSGPYYDDMVESCLAQINEARASICTCEEVES